MMRLVMSQQARLARMRQMTLQELQQKALAKLRHFFSVSRRIREAAYAFDKFSLRFFEDSYVERPESGPGNLAIKLERVKAGGPFEPYSVALINKAAAQLIGDAKNILEVGCGTGMFASLVSANPGVRITASEFDEPALEWAKQNRAAPNIRFGKFRLEDFAADSFDLVATLEVIEHLTDYAGFIAQLIRVAPQALITTPNRNRAALESVSSPPSFSEHTREWTSGEFLWVLRVFYRHVNLYTLPNFHQQVAAYRQDASYQPKLVRCSVLAREEPLIAVCKEPRRDIFRTEV